MKTNETKRIERLLLKYRHKGCIAALEVGFGTDGIVDFCSLNSGGELKCYEIKISMQDFRSENKLTWVGVYNYMVVSNRMYRKHAEEIESETPKHVGIIVANVDAKRMSKTDLVQIRRAKRSKQKYSNAAALRRMAAALDRKITKIVLEGEEERS